MSKLKTNLNLNCYPKNLFLRMPDSVLDLEPEPGLGSEKDLEKDSGSDLANSSCRLRFLYWRSEQRILHQSQLILPQSCSRK